MTLTRAARPAELALLAAIRTWSTFGPPRLTRVVPAGAAPGEPVLLLGAGFAGGELCARFGAVKTWAVALSPSLAVSYVPPGAGGGPITLQRLGLRLSGGPPRGPSGSGPTRIERVDPSDGSTGVFRDVPVLARFSRPVGDASVDAASFRVEDELGILPGVLQLSPDRAVAIWQPERRLRAGVEHRVVVRGVRDLRGEPVEPHESAFRTGSLSREDVYG